MKRILFIFILLFNFVYAQCPDSIRPLNNNYDTFRVYWGNKPNAKKIKFDLRKVSSNKKESVKLFSDDTLFISKKVVNITNWDVVFVNYNKNSYYCNKALPVELIYFKKEKISNNQYRLKWATASETNNNYFLVEKFIGKNKWATEVQVESKSENGNSVVKLEYQTIITLSDDISYYRLAQYDYDGTKSYSDIIKIKLNSQKEVYNFYNMRGDKVYKGTKEEFCNKFNKYQLYFYKDDKGFKKIVITDG